MEAAQVAGGDPICDPTILPTDSLPKGSSADSAIMELLREDNLFMKAKRDTSWANALRNNWEYFFYVGEINGNKNIVGYKTDSLEDEVSLDTTGLYRYKIVLDYHTHQDRFPKDRHPQDPVDLLVSNKWYQNNLNFRSYVDCGDTLYVIVNESTDLLKQYFKTKNLKREHSSWVIPMYNSTNRRKDGMDLLLALIGASGVSGLGIYKSTDNDKLNFIKLN